EVIIMNKVNIIGNLTRDIELKESDKCIYSNFSIAINTYNSKRQEDVATFIEVVAFNKSAEILSKHGKKGRKIAIEGRLKNDSYTSSDGIKKHKIEVILEKFYFLDYKKNVS
ncbi:single-stranded DNA-binding protein, partial [Clostridium sp.]|uniref:single-stranded DNA-binding protein n=1 Tax=Clostridium sp. TaxID=1506 RepID=UPI003F3542F1